jgi:DNA replication licensing factor MCM7
MAERDNRERTNRDEYNYPQILEELEKCDNFLRNFKLDDDEMPYSVQLQEISNRQRKVLSIELDHILDYKRDEEFVNNIKRNTLRYVTLFSQTAQTLLPQSTMRLSLHNHDIIDNLVAQRATQLQVAQDNGLALGQQNGDGELDVPSFITKRFDVIFTPLSNDSNKPKKLREVRASDIGHLVTIRGMVTRANDVKPHIVGCTYICDTCGGELYQEVTGSQFMPILTCTSLRCKDNKSTGRINMMNRGSKFIKYQELRVQELPDQVPVGHIPRTITVQCKGETTRQCGPGDIVTISGIFLAQKIQKAFQSRTSLTNTTYLNACIISKEKQNYNDITNGLDSEANKLVTEIANDPDPYARLAASIAPEIFGHEDVKKALLLQLVGGVSRSLSDGMKIRGDINICLMGDPGVAKSQLLKYIATAAPRGVYTTGKGSSGVGLTAAVIRDPVTGDLSLEGGALVLADKGICCIDEFDKMDDNDRTAIHEVMEQQTISIAKAGITTTLNARAAVLAAANPLHGRYNKNKTVSENVDLPNSLLSRFDLLFLLLDRADMETDLALSRHVLHVHRYLKKPETAHNPLSATQVKQYISIARAIAPTVPLDLTQYICEQFVELRQRSAEGETGTGGNNWKSNRKSNKTDQAVMTARQLLSILRLSQGLARLALRNTISHEDVDEAMRLTHASKSSLADDDQYNRTAQEDVVSAIYTIMRDFAAQRGTNIVEFNHIELMILKKGFSNQQLRNCLEEYESLGVLSFDEQASKITFDQ